MKDISVIERWNLTEEKVMEREIYEKNKSFKNYLRPKYINLLLKEAVVTKRIILSK